MIQTSLRLHREPLSAATFAEQSGNDGAADCERQQRADQQGARELELPPGEQRLHHQSGGRIVTHRFLYSRTDACFVTVGTACPFSINSRILRPFGAFDLLHVSKWRDGTTMTLNGGGSLRPNRVEVTDFDLFEKLPSMGRSPSELVGKSTHIYAVARFKNRLSQSVLLPVVKRTKANRPAVGWLEGNSLIRTAAYMGTFDW